jgi:excisionase family DNA binding protein
MTRSAAKGEALRTVEEAAKDLTVSPGKVYVWIAERALGHVRLGRSIRVPVSEIRKFLAARAVRAARRS